MHLASIILLGWASLSNAVSQIPIDTFINNECSVASTITPNVSIPLDTCIVTVGMQSYRLHTTPCAGGGATTVQQFAFSDQRCSNQWNSYFSSGSNNPCLYADNAGSAFGSILLTCKSKSQGPQPDGTFTTISVGAVATGAAPPSSGAASSSNSSGSGSGSGSGSNSSSPDDCAGWMCLSLGEKIGIVVALAVGIPPIIIALYMCQRKRNKNKEAAAAMEFPSSQSWPQQSPHSYPNHETNHSIPNFGGGQRLPMPYPGHEMSATPPSHSLAQQQDYFKFDNYGHNLAPHGRNYC